MTHLQTASITWRDTEQLRQEALAAHVAQLQVLPPAQTGTAQHEGPGLEHPFCLFVHPSITIRNEETWKSQSPSWGQAALIFQNAPWLSSLLMGIIISWSIFGSPNFLLPLPPKSTATNSVCSCGAGCPQRGSLTTVPASSQPRGAGLGHEVCLPVTSRANSARPGEQLC